MLSRLCSTRMEKIFEKGVAEHLSSRTFSIATVDPDVELQNMTKRKERRDQDQNYTMYKQEATIKRPRLCDQLLDGQGDRHKVLADEETTRRTYGKDTLQNRVLEDSDAAKIFKRPTDWSTSTSDPGTREAVSSDQYRAPHLTRSRVTSTNETDGSKGSPTRSPERWQSLRFSKTNDLGPRWKRPLLYPQTGKKKTTVEWKDLERLDDGEFLNDNLIGFYLRHLEIRLEERDPELAKRVYWFNTFFFASLTQTARGQGRINYDAVKKWTRNVDLFNFDYIIVPINESAHWYIAIICNLPALNRVLSSTGHEVPKSPSTRFEVLDNSGKDDSDGTPQPRSVLNTPNLHTPGDDVEMHDEEHTRESLAELRIQDVSTHSEQQEATAQSTGGDDDDDMLDSAVQNISEAQTNKNVETEDNEERDKTDNSKGVNEQSPSERRVKLQKKGKRKSNPPAKTLDPNQPTIITLDSLGIAHSPTIRVLKDYLHAEGMDKRGGMEFEDSEIKGCTAKQIPQQDNFCDCGLFLLGYMERFPQSPKEFVTKILRREFDGSKDWPKMEPSAMRTEMRELIMKLYAEQEGLPVAEHKVATPAVERHKEQRPTPPKPQIVNIDLQDDGLTASASSAMPNGGEAQEQLKIAPTTRKQALETASLIDEPEHLPQSQMTSSNVNTSSQTQARIGSPVNLEELESMIIPDSQEDRENEPSPANLEGNASHPAGDHGIEVRIDKSDPHSLLPAKVKSSPDRERAVQSPKRGKEKRHNGPPSREDKDIIAIDP